MTERPFPAPFGVSITLSAVDTTAFWVLEDKLIASNSLKDFDEQMVRIIAAPEEEINYNVKLALATCHYACHSINGWAFRNLEAPTLASLAFRQDITPDLAYQLVNNKNLTWNVLRSIIATSYHSDSSKEKIISLLPKGILTHDLAIHILHVGNAWGLDSAVFTKPMRELYSFDSSIPDSWIIHSFRVAN